MRRFFLILFFALCMVSFGVSQDSTSPVIDSFTGNYTGDDIFRYVGNVSDSGSGLDQFSFSTNASGTVQQFNGAGSTEARFNSSLGVPQCLGFPGGCQVPSSMIKSKDGVSPGEPNSPNTLDSATDGSQGSYQSDESIESINITPVNQGSVLDKGGRVNVSVDFYTFDASSDVVNIAYTSDISNPSWTVKDSFSPNSDGKLSFNTTFAVDSSSTTHAVRAIIEYNGDSSTTEQTSGYGDQDDVVFNSLDTNLSDTSIYHQVPFYIEFGDRSLIERSLTVEDNNGNTQSQTTVDNISSAITVNDTEFNLGYTSGWFKPNWSSFEKVYLQSDYTGTLTNYTLLNSQSSNAVFDDAYNAPVCESPTDVCQANSSLLLSRDGVGPGEPNAPNTIDSADDGTSVTDGYEQDESVENITVESLDNSEYFAKGDQVEVTIWYYCYGSSDIVNIAYASDISSPNWEVKSSESCSSSSGPHKTNTTFSFSDVEGKHAVRAIIEYNGDSSTTESTSGYGEQDDLVISTIESGVEFIRETNELSAESWQIGRSDEYGLFKVSHSFNNSVYNRWWVENSRGDRYVGELTQLTNTTFSGLLNISAEFRDNDSGMYKTVLATNETGSWKNYSYLGKVGKYDSVATVGLQDSDPIDLDFSENGSKMIEAGKNDNTIYQYSCSTPYNVTSCSYNGESINPQSTAITAAGYWDDGSTLVEQDGSKYYEYSCSTPYNVTSCSYTGNSVDTANSDGVAKGMYLRENGRNIYEMNPLSGGSDYISQLTCSTPYDLTSCSYSGVNISVEGKGSGDPNAGVEFTKFGEELIVAGDSYLYDYSCSKGFDLSTCSYTGANISVFENKGITIADEARKLYGVQYSSGYKVTQYNVQSVYGGDNFLSTDPGIWELSSFNWDNDSFSGHLGYKVWGQDNSGNWNVTDTGVDQVIKSYEEGSSSVVGAAGTLYNSFLASDTFSSSTNIVPSLTSVLDLGENALQSISVTDVMAEDLSLTSGFSEVVGVGNVFSSSSVLDRVLVEGVGVGNVFDATVGLNRSDSEQVQVVPIASRNISGSVFSQSVINSASTLSTALDSSRSIFETVSVGNVFDATVGLNRSDSEQVGVATLVDTGYNYTEGVVRGVSVVSDTGVISDLFRDSSQQVDVSELLGGTTVFADRSNSQVISVLQEGGVDNIGVDAVQSISVSGISTGVSTFFEGYGEDILVSGSVSESVFAGRTSGQSIGVTDSLDRNLSVLDSAAEVISTGSSAGVVNNYLGVGSQVIGVSDSVVRDIVLSRAVASSPVVSGDVGTGLVSYFDARQSVGVASSTVRNIDIDFNPLQVIGLDGLTGSNTAPRVENVTVQVQNVGRDRQVTVQADIQDVDGSNDREKVTLGDNSKEITGGMGRTIEIDIDDSTGVNQVLTAYDDSGATTEFLLDYSMTDNVYQQKMDAENNLSVQYVNISNEFTAGNMMAPIKVNFSHFTYGGENLTNSYKVKTLSSQGEILNITTEVKGDFLEDTLQWHTREDKYNTVDNQSIAATVNVSTVIDYLDWSQVESGSVESPDPFGSCDDCSSKAISVPVSGFSSEQLYTDTGDGVGNQFEQDIKDVVLGERNEYWDEYRYYNISGGVEFRDIWLNLTVDESETEYTKPFIRIRDNNTYNNTFIPPESQSCSTTSTDIESFSFNNDEWKMCSQDLNNSGVPEYFRLKIPHFSEYNIRFGFGEAPAERFAYRESDPCPDSLEGDTVGANSSLVCHQNLVMTPEQARLEQRDVSRVVGQGFSGLVYIVVFVLALVVVFFTTRDEDDSFPDFEPFR